jgi:hypothetical protein
MNNIIFYIAILFFELGFLLWLIGDPKENKNIFMGIRHGKIMMICSLMTILIMVLIKHYNI